jgi:hypothetical protein
MNHGLSTARNFQATWLSEYPAAFERMFIRPFVRGGDEDEKEYYVPTKNDERKYTFGANHLSVGVTAVPSGRRLARAEHVHSRIHQDDWIHCSLSKWMVFLHTWISACNYLSEGVLEKLRHKHTRTQTRITTLHCGRIFFSLVWADLELQGVGRQSGPLSLFFDFSSLLSGILR